MTGQRRIVYPDADGADFILDQGPLRERLDQLGEFSAFMGTPENDDDFLSRIGDAEAIILGWHLPDTVLHSCPALKVVAFTGIGAANQVNLDLARTQGVTVCNTPGYANQTVAEHCMGLILSAARQIPQLDRDCRAGLWPHDRPAFDLHGKTLGLVGLGGIGKTTAKLAQAFGMRVIAWTAHPSPERAAEAGVTFVEWEDLFREADVVSLQLLLTEETRDIITQRELDQMRDGSLLVNTARGELVEEKALIATLESGRISAGLDVFHQEPLASDHPLRRLDNVVLTPHTGYNTPDAIEAIYALSVANLEAYFSGHPVNVVN